MLGQLFWAKTHLVIMCNTFYMLLDLVCWYFIYIYIFIKMY